MKTHQKQTHEQATAMKQHKTTHQKSMENKQQQSKQFKHID